MTDTEFFELLRNYFTNASTAIEATINNTIINRINDLEKKLIKLQYQQTENTEYADKWRNLEEEIGCPLDVLVKLWKNHEFYALTPKGRTRVRQMMFPTISYILKGNKNQKMPYIDNSFILGGTCYDYDLKDLKRDEYASWDVNLKDYKKTWWLREDKSE